jgi:asparagine synthase (glutamine-hydrolysing)
MSGIAGIVSSRPVPVEAVRRMSAAQAHRGPREIVVELPGIALAFRSRAALAFDDVVHGQDCQRVAAVMEGQLYNADELADRDTNVAIRGSESLLLSALWQKKHEQLFDELRGQFAVAIWDEANRQLLLGRDHFGICPLHWSLQGDYLLFASEIKALLASGLVDTKVDLFGINHVWTFFGVPGPTTCFQGVSALLPGHLISTRVTGGERLQVQPRSYWRMNFPDVGQEDDSRSEAALVDEYSNVMQRAVADRLAGDGSVAVYSSGGLDSSVLLSIGSKLRKQPIDTFTFHIRHPNLNESALAATVGKYTGSVQNVVELSGNDLLNAFPRVVRAAESPVIDVSASALLQLAERAGAAGHNAVVTGEGADELQACYPWFRIRQRLDRVDRCTRLPLSGRGFRSYLQLVHRSQLPWSFVRRSGEVVGHDNAWLLAYMLMSSAKWRFFSQDALATLGEHVPFDDLQLDRDGLRRWSPLNRSIYLGTRIHLTGLHLAARGDRAACLSGVQTRYPFLDRAVFDLLAPLDARWKIRRLTDKYLERQLAHKWLPNEVTAGHKSLLHAPLEALHLAQRPVWAEQLLSEEALRKTPYFNAPAVRDGMAAFPKMRHGFRRLFIEMGLVGVFTTQLWHHLYVESNLCELPDDK